MKAKATLIAGLAAAVLFSTAGTNADAATFIDLRTGPGPDDRIKGEATEAGHEEWITILSMGVSADKGAHTTTRRRGAPRLSDVVIVKEIDKSSPKLQEAAFSGEVFPEMIVKIPLDDTHPGFIAKLTDVRVTGFKTSWALSGDADDRPTEEVSFYYNQIEFIYRPDANGTPVSRSVFDLLFGTDDPERDDDQDGLINSRDDDDDNDGVDDRYELINGMHPLVDDADYDDDGDGKTNREEWLAGTYADDINSKFGIHSIAFDREGKVMVRVPTIGGRHYKLRGSFDLANGNWMTFDEFDTEPGSEPGMMELMLPPGAAAQYDRLFFSAEVSLPDQPQ